MSMEVASIMGSPQLSPRGCVFLLACVSAAGCDNKSSCEVSASPKGSHYFPTAASLCWALGMPLLYGKKKRNPTTNKPTKNKTGKTKKKSLLEQILSNLSRQTRQCWPCYNTSTSACKCYNSHVSWGWLSPRGHAVTSPLRIPHTLLEAQPGRLRWQLVSYQLPVYLLI